MRTSCLINNKEINICNGFMLSRNEPSCFLTKLLIFPLLPKMISRSLIMFMSIDCTLIWRLIMNNNNGKQARTHNLISQHKARCLWNQERTMPWIKSNKVEWRTLIAKNRIIYWIKWIPFPHLLSLLYNVFRTWNKKSLLRKKNKLGCAVWVFLIIGFL